MSAYYKKREESLFTYAKKLATENILGNKISFDLIFNSLAVVYNVHACRK